MASRRPTTSYGGHCFQSSKIKSIYSTRLYNCLPKLDQDIQPAGYASPPANHQFKKGKSGNPKGRPKKKVGEFTILQRVLKCKVNLKGEERKIPISAALIHKLLELALSGDRCALDRQRRILSETSSKDDGIDHDETRDRILRFFDNRDVKVSYEGSCDD
jgi:hypothetical protein